MRNPTYLQIFGGVFAAGLAILTSASASASETRGFVVRWFYYANISEDADCPHGMNPGADGIFRNILKDRGTPPEQIEQLMESFPDSMYKANIGNRGTIDGKPANVYVNPTSVKDTMIHLGEGKKGLGFNLDNQDGPQNFKDPETGETGVDNMFYRVIGCTSQLRSAPGVLPTMPEIQWDMTRDHTPAWLVEIAGIDDMQNDDDVTVRVVQATQPVRRDNSRNTQADVTFVAAPTTRTENNIVHGKIKNGTLTTDVFDFYMPGQPFYQSEFAFRKARMRFTFNPDGSVRGVLGGYQNWRTIYASWALGGTAFEVNSGYDMPGLYYALRKSADAYPDPATGENTFISSAFIIDAIPAFILNQKNQVAGGN